MQFVFLLFVVGIVVISIYRFLKKKTLPSNLYTPFDDLTQQNIKVDLIIDEENREGKQ